MEPLKTNTYSDYLPSRLSLTFEEMDHIHTQMMKGIGTDPDAVELYEDLLAQALRYSNFRTNWALWSLEEKMNQDASRTSCHNSLIVKFNVLARYLKKSGCSPDWRDALGDETADPYTRKRIGDFACYLVFVNGINER